MVSLSTRMAGTRPTAVNLFWAIERMKKRFDELAPEGVVATVVAGHRGGSRRHPKRGHRDQSPHGCPRRGARSRRRAHPDALQRGGARHRGLRHRARRDARRERGGQERSTSSPTRPVRSSKGRASPPGSSPRTMSPSPSSRTTWRGYFMAKGEIDMVILGSDRIASETVTCATRSEPTRSRCSRKSTASRSTPSRRRRPSISRSQSGQEIPDRGAHS